MCSRVEKRARETEKKKVKLQKEWKAVKMIADLFD